jgi:hypothetical protein
MLVSPDYRVSLADTQPVAAAPELEAVFVGSAFANARPAAAMEARAAAVALGFGSGADDPAMVGRPLAFASAAAFLAAFPNDGGWLSQAVQDYFAAGAQRAWVVRVEVDPARPLDAYVTQTPPPAGSLPDTGLEIALQVPSAGLLVLPDLEQACLAGSLPPPQAPVAPPDPPAFRPLADFVVPPPPVVSPQPAGAATVSPYDVLTRVSAALASLRPDMILLFALPIGADQTQSTAALLRRTDQYLHGDSLAGPDLPQVQAFAPLLRSPSGAIATPSGLLAGVLAAVAETDGVWRSIAGRTLPSAATPLRRIESNALDELRQKGVATLRFVTGTTALDDDILAVRDTPAAAASRAGGTRRLMGWLLRNLQDLGEQLVFETVLDDGRVELILMDLFDSLLSRGALNGRQVSDAVTITRRNPANNAVEFDIGVNTAVALETIRLRFLDGSLTTSLAVAA